MSDGTGRRVARLLGEAGMIVFAVLVALGLEEWRDERQMLDFADRARASVESELAANLEELRNTRPHLLHVDSVLVGVIQAQDMDALGESIDVQLPDLSDAVWRVAQGSQAAAYLDFEWMLRIARAYEVLEVYGEASDHLIAAMSGIIGRPEPTVEHVAEIYGWLVILNDVQRQAIEQLDRALADPAGA
jgi:hypothetical protein